MLRRALRRLIVWALAPTPEEQARSQRAFDAAMELMVAEARRRAGVEPPENAPKLH